jgi:hypothetical protein
MGIDLTGIIAQAGPWGVTASVALTVIMAMIRGDLVPRKSHVDAISYRDDVIRDITRDRDFYRTHTHQLLGITDAATDRLTQVMLNRGLPPERNP